MSIKTFYPRLCKIFAAQYTPGNEREILDHLGKGSSYKRYEDKGDVVFAYTNARGRHRVILRPNDWIVYDRLSGALFTMNPSEMDAAYQQVDS